MKIWFTSDQHFGHENILKYQAATRQFSSLKEMDEAYIAAWNQQVADDDTVYHLGDFCLRPYELVRTYFARLKGDIKVIEGNHDRWFTPYRKTKDLFKSASGHPVHARMPIVVIREDVHRITLCHYPMRSWSASNHGSWHVYGHVHKNIEPWGMSMDVGVDGSGGALYSYEDVKEYMAQRLFELMEKHGQDCFEPHDPGDLRRVRADYPKRDKGNSSTCGTASV